MNLLSVLALELTRWMARRRCAKYGHLAPIVRHEPPTCSRCRLVLT